MGRLDIDALSEHVAAELDRWSVAGIELCVVAGGEVIFSGGFGSRDLSKELPVTARTLFHHGSTAKAFTGAVAAALIDDGLLEWDRPVMDYLPELRLSDPVATERVTLADLLTHRSGLPQHEWAWLAHPSEGRDELLRRLPHLEMNNDFRVAFQYSNLAYALAGHLIGVVTDSAWEDQLRDRILEPLGMGRTFTSVAAMEADEDHAVPYEERNGTPFETAFRRMDAIGPAGGIISCAEDTARWLLFQLGDGTFDGRLVLTEESFMTTRSVHMPVEVPTPDSEVVYTGYGFGWVLGTYRSRRLIWHNGGVDGFKTEMVILPEALIGIAACANTTYTSLFAQAIAYHAADLLLEEEPKPWSEQLRERWLTQMSAAREENAKQRVVESTTPSHPVEEFTGVYEHPGYGVLEVTSGSGGELRITLGELDFVTNYRHFDTWTISYDALESTFPVTFETDAEGFVTEAVVPLEGSLPPIRFRRRAG